MLLQQDPSLGHLYGLTRREVDSPFAIPKTQPIFHARSQTELVTGPPRAQLYAVTRHISSLVSFVRSLIIALQKVSTRRERL
jgi:hypothetical protein